MWNYFWVALGGAIGSVGRFWLSGLLAQHWGARFPWGTLLVNVSGSFAIGFFATLCGPQGRFPLGPRVSQFIMVGVLGGYTTFSAFSLQTLDLARDGNWLGAGMNIVASVVLCLAAVWLGHVCAAALTR